MLSFITDTNRKKVSLEYFSRVMIIFFASLFAITLILIALFVPSTFSSKYKNQTLTAQLSSIQNVYKNSGEDPSSLIKKLNSLTRLFINKNNVSSYPDIIQKIISIKGSSIKLNSIMISGQDSVRQISISGKALNRDALTGFDKALKTDGFFSNINLPISDLIKNDNPSFTITMTLK